MTHLCGLILPGGKDGFFTVFEFEVCEKKRVLCSQDIIYNYIGLRYLRPDSRSVFLVFKQAKVCLVIPRRLILRGYSESLGSTARTSSIDRH